MGLEAVTCWPFWATWCAPAAACCNCMPHSKLGCLATPSRRVLPAAQPPHLLGPFNSLLPSSTPQADLGVCCARAAPLCDQPGGGGGPAAACQLWRGAVHGGHAARKEKVLRRGGPTLLRVGWEPAPAVPMGLLRAAAALQADAWLAHADHLLGEHIARGGHFS